MGSCSQVVNQAKFSGCGKSVRLVAVENQITRLIILQHKKHKEKLLEMLHQMISLAFLSSVKCIPVNEKSNNQDTIDNIINVDEKPVKQVELDSIDSSSTVPLGSQFAVEFLIPERKKLETGHRIPLHLFPIETQNRILEVEKEEEVDEEKYIDSSSFRQARPQPLSEARLSAVDITLSY